jgi:hypothetical protein
VALDVLEETVSGANISNCPCDIGPQVPGIVCSFAFTGGAERLAGIPARDDVYAVTKRSAIEGFNIRPDRRDIQPRRFHLRDQVADTECFPLHKKHRSEVWDNSFKPEINAPVSSA